MQAASPSMLTALPARFQAWFAQKGWTPRAHQLAMIARARDGRHTLLIAPTGGGKTLAGFLPSLIDLDERPKPNTPRGVHTLYISPLKALAVDIARNLITPIEEMGLRVRVESRTGDTSLAKRQRQKASPPDILLTTPEQLALFCAWEGARAYFADLQCVIIDEVHALHGSKRGDLLSLGLARLHSLAPQARRVGLSATVVDPDHLRRWIAPAPEVADLVLGEAGAAPQIEVLLSDERVPWAGHTAQHAMAEVYETIKTARTALVFVNTRWQAEFAFQALWRLNEDNLPIALHHGSLAPEQRRKVEAAMTRGELRAVVCTSTLDLGIDWGAVDLVIQLAAPKGSSRLVQRIGRANHRLEEASRAILVPANRFEMLECQAAREAVAAGAMDGEVHRTGALDVLAQHLMGAVCGEALSSDALFEEAISAAPYQALTREAFDGVLNFVATGGYALRTYDQFHRIVLGQDGLWRARNPQTALRHRLNVGAIVTGGTLTLRVSSGRHGGGRKLGEVEEWYVEQLTPGDTFLFGGQVWRFEGVSGNDARVTRSSDPQPKIPSWGGAKFAMSSHLAGRVRAMIMDQAAWSRLPGDVQDWLGAQKAYSAIPAADELLVETFPRGKKHYLVCYPFEGRLAHTTLAMLLTRRLDRLGIGPLGFVCNDYTLCIWALGPMDGLDLDALFQQDMLGDDLEAWLEDSVMMKRLFRQCALISGLIERRFPGLEKSGRQVTFSSDLIYDVLRRHQPDHFLLSCARADAASGLLDIERLGQLLARIVGHIRPKPLGRVSPFAVPIMMEIGRETVTGTASDDILEEAGMDLIAEAMA
jgi:ATP-dependent Lhr-like helicase